MSNGAGKWRPTLGMITTAMISVVLILAIGGFAVVRFNVDSPADIELSVAALIAVAGASVVGWVFVRTVSRPLRELAGRAEAIARGERGAIGPLKRHGTRELARVSASFMEMAQNLSDRSEYMRIYARHVSHELKTPLTAIRGAAELVSDGEAMAPEERRRLLAIVLEEVERTTRLIERLGEQARADSPDLGGVSSLEALAPDLRARFPGLELKLKGEVGAGLALSSENAAIIFGHLLHNASQHGARSVAIDVLNGGDSVLIGVQDDGPGVSAGNRGRIFDPFFTTRRGQGGTGMGLTIVRSLLDAHGGAITLCESVRGARFEISAPPARIVL